jgi:hypothetical protein
MELPPLKVRRALVQRYARLRVQLADELGDRPLVLPNEEYFPDPFRPDQGGVRRLVARMQQHAGMQDIPIYTRLVTIEGGPGGCGSGSCSPGSDDAKQKGERTEPQSAGQACCSTGPTPGVDGSFQRLVDDGEQWRLQIPDIEAPHAVVLTANIARALGHIFLAETQEEGRPLDRPLELTGELAAVALGFGVLLLEGSYIYSKSCCGPRIGRVTVLGTAELAIACALFAHLGGHRPREARKALSTTQKALFGEAVSWAEANRQLLDRLKNEPHRLVDGNFDVVDAEPWLGRLLGSRKRTASARSGDPEMLLDEASLQELENLLAVMPAKRQRKPKPRDPRDEELRALVDDALGKGG